ncbi:MAG: hypothetical protein E7568_03925 [Ruminococcaceae bacterium]|nr:hypothetical protein [Oscillospiraceae bacterium]
MNVRKLIFLNPAEIIPPKESKSGYDRYRLFLLSESIRENGLLLPITVAVTESGYRVISGERRVKASILAGLKKIPCVVTEVADERLFRAAESLCAEEFDRRELKILSDKYGNDFVAQVLSMTTGELTKLLNASDKKSEQKTSATVKEKKLPPIKDTRFIINSIKQMIDSVSSAGIPVRYKQNDKEDCVEIKIRLMKDTVNSQMSIF